WSSKRSMLVYASGTIVALVAFAVVNPARPEAVSLFVPLTTVLLASSNGMLSMLSPYAAEIYPTTLRASGSGMAAAGTKVGGMFGPLLLTSAPGVSVLALGAMLPVVLAAGSLWRLGPETTAEGPLDPDIADPAEVTARA